MDSMAEWCPDRVLDTAVPLLLANTPRARSAISDEPLELARMDYVGYTGSHRKTQLMKTVEP